MKVIPPVLPVFQTQKLERYGDKDSARQISVMGNINAFAAGVLLIAGGWVIPFDPYSVLFWPRGALLAFILYCAGAYAHRAYFGFLTNLTERQKVAFNNDETRTIAGADARWATLSDLAAASMLDNPNERFLGMIEGPNGEHEPVFAPPGTTFVKYVGKQGSGKTTTYICTQIIHLMNTVGRFTKSDEHADIGAGGQSGTEEETFDQDDDLDEFSLFAEVYE